MVSISDENNIFCDTFQKLQNMLKLLFIGWIRIKQKMILLKDFCDYFEDTLVENEAVLVHVKLLLNL